MRLGFQLSKLTFDSVRCGMWYQRIMETRDEGIFDSCHDLVANPMEIPSTRQPLNVEVDDDPAHFRRVRLKCRYCPPPLPPPRYICDLSAGIDPGWGWQNNPSNLDLSQWSSPNNGSEGQSNPFQHHSTSFSPQMGHTKKELIQKRTRVLTAERTAEGRVLLVTADLTAEGRVHAYKVRKLEPLLQLPATAYKMHSQAQEGIPASVYH